MKDSGVGHHPLSVPTSLSFLALAGLLPVVWMESTLSGEVDSLIDFDIVEPTVLLSFIALGIVFSILALLSKGETSKVGKVVRYGGYATTLLLYAAISGIVYSLLWIYMAVSDGFAFIISYGFLLNPPISILTWVLLFASLLRLTFFKKKGFYDKSWHLGFLTFLAGMVGWGSLAGALSPSFSYLPRFRLHMLAPIFFIGGIVLTAFIRRKIKPKRHWRAYFGGMVIGWQIILLTLLLIFSEV